VQFIAMGEIGENEALRGPRLKLCEDRPGQFEAIHQRLF
jgi:hypothetical protein